jgi:hypothetical protein
MQKTLYETIGTLYETIETLYVAIGKGVWVKHKRCM